MRESGKKIAPLASGMRWPGGAYIEVARLAVTEHSLSTYFGRDLLGGDEPGLGPWRAIGMQTRAGAVAELITYAAESGAGFTLRVDVLSDPRSVFDEVVMALLTGIQDVLWQSSVIGGPADA